MCVHDYKYKLADAPALDAIVAVEVDNTSPWQVSIDAFGKVVCALTVAPLLLTSRVQKFIQSLIPYNCTRLGCSFDVQILPNPIVTTQTHQCKASTWIGILNDLAIVSCEDIHELTERDTLQAHRCDRQSVLGIRLKLR